MDSTSNVVAVTVIKVSGSTIFGPRDIARTFTVKGLKSLFDISRPKSLVFGLRILEDTQTFQEFPASVLLTVTYANAMGSDNLVDLGDEMSHYTVWEQLHPGRQIPSIQAERITHRYKATLLGQSSSSFVAIKRMPLSSEDGVPNSALREVALLQQCDHPNIIRLRETVLGTEYLYTITEHVDLDLETYIKACGAVTDPKLLEHLVRMCFRGIEYCHGRAIMHRGIMPKNIRINVDTMQVKLADFRSAREFSLPLMPCTQEVMWLWYSAPEILMGITTYGPAIDIWSMGTVFMEMASCKTMFPGDSEIGTLFCIFQTLGTPTVERFPGLSELPYFKSTFPEWKTEGLEKRLTQMAPHLCADGLQLLMACLTYDYTQRPSARRCLTFEFLIDVDAQGDTNIATLQAPVVAVVGTGIADRKSSHVTLADITNLTTWESVQRGKTDKLESYNHDAPPVHEAAMSSIKRKNDAARIGFQNVTEYAADIHAFRSRDEVEFLPAADYMETQVDITSEMRSSLINWWVDVHMKLHLRPETLHLAISLTDRYMSKTAVMRTRLQLVICVAISIASKMGDVHPPELRQWVDYAGCNWNAWNAELLQLERHMLTTLSFHIVVPTTFHFFEFLQTANNCDGDMHRTVAQYFLELGLLDIGLLQHTPSHVASAAVLLSNRNAKRNAVWPSNMEEVSGHSEVALAGCVEQLRQLYEADQEDKGGHGHFKAVYSKFGRLHYFHEALSFIECIPTRMGEQL